MPNLRVATLGGSNLPIQFSYLPEVSPLRASFTPVAGGVIMQHANDATPDVPREIKWTIMGATPSEFQALLTIYNNATPQVNTFTGYEEDSFEVVISELVWKKMYGGVFDLEGAFTVLAVNDEIAPICFSTTPTITQTL